MTLAGNLFVCGLVAQTRWPISWPSTLPARIPECLLALSPCRFHFLVILTNSVACSFLERFVRESSPLTS